ncbi:hypothetical protein PHO31112_04042 [Pandoraea horticolens]|uniref:Uncharacterized protein n=1 Tax=Pandoraea horticolens TaxID=2508298 RepID=A0A5E4XSA1_9BURK|nr:hypothetical protein [Pandoraea horticolens]VVE38942.1 hypothetical protein PHO31112_04042 [Pandoraea horticolens]
MLACKAVRDIAPASLLSHLHKKLSHLTRVEQDIRIDECLKFLFLASVRLKGGEGAYIAVNQDIDEVWHECILQTREYESLCMALPGKQFIHHSSSEEGYRGYVRDTGASKAADEHVWWLENYYLHFGEHTRKSSEHWISVIFLMKTLQLSLVEINRIARGETIQKPVAYDVSQAEKTTAGIANS